MLNNFFSLVGLHDGSPIVLTNEFWNTPLGIVVSASICVCSAFNVLHKSVDDDLFDRVWYSAVAIIMFIATLVGLNPETQPKHIIQTLLFLVWVRFVATSIQHYLEWRKTGCPQKSR
jgi:steroid 5-alpha reductase family enzyme